ncbi:MAG: hypothetical protein ABR562_00725 [Thermoplasmatota archaeon]
MDLDRPRPTAPRPPLVPAAPPAARPAPRTPPAATVTPAPTPAATPAPKPWWPWALAAVPVSSILGLARLMLRDGASVFGKVWGANLWADLLFVGGTVGAFLASAAIANRKGRPTGTSFAAGVGAGFVLHYATYLVAAFLSGAPSRLSLAGHYDGGGFWNVFVTGLIGLAGMAFAGPLLALFMPRPAAEPTEPAVAMHK